MQCLSAQTSNRQVALFQPEAIRSSLLLEYLFLLMFCHSSLGALCWVTVIHHGIVPVVMIISGVWIALSSTGFLGGRRIGLQVTSVLLAICFTVLGRKTGDIPIWLTRSFISPTVWVGMLTVLLLSQIIHFRREQISQLNRYEKRIWDAGFCLKCVLGIVFTWGIIFPLTTSFWNSFSNERLAKLERLPLISDIGFRLSESFVTLCFALFGANVGSFLNVVVWRVPRGESVIWGESHCPKCASKIRTTDNLPILGWLRLGGRCRDCQTDISTRYPIVESITMFAFLLYYFVQLISGGANIPFRSINSYRGVLWIIMYPKWDLIGLYLYHIGLFSLLLVWALILRDGGRIPRRSMIYSLLITALVQVAAPALFVVSPFAPLKSLSVIPTQHLLHVGISLTFAILVGSTFAVLLKSLFLQNDVSGWENIAFPLCLTGIAQGWQSIFFISLFLVAIRCCFPKGQLRASSFAMTVLVLHILSFVFWRLEWQAILHSLSITTRF